MDEDAEETEDNTRMTVGVCGVCGKAVTDLDSRTKEVDGSYLHASCTGASFRFLPLTRRLVCVRERVVLRAPGSPAASSLSTNAMRPCLVCPCVRCCATG